MQKFSQKWMLNLDFDPNYFNPSFQETISSTAHHLELQWLLNILKEGCRDDVREFRGHVDVNRQEHDQPQQ